MLGSIARALIRKAPAARLQSVVVRRRMATESMELPKTSGVVWLLGGIGIFCAVAAWVNYNDLIVWGVAPERPKSE